MGFRNVKKQVLECLNGGLILHATDRSNIDVKNLLATGVVSVEEVAEVIGRTRGNEYECSPLHADRSLDVHILETTHNGTDWYIKWYFVEPNVVFISVH